MNKSTLLRLFGWLCILVVVGLICYVVLFYYGEYLGVETQTTRIIVVTTVLLALCYIFKLWQMNALKSVLISYVPLLKYKSIIYFFMPWKSSDKANVGNNTTATLDSNIFINIHSTLKENYGRRWRAKTRVLLVMGDATQVAGALMLLEQQFSQREESIRPGLGALYSALENRLAQSGGAQALVPQNISAQPSRHSAETLVLKSIASGRELLEQARLLAKYLSDQPDGWLAAHHLMKSVRLDTVSQLPPPDGTGRTRLESPKSDYRAQLKRLYLQQNWTELIELTDSLFVEGVNHFWLDVQWYLHQALTRAGSPWDKNATIIISDLKMLLHRMPGLETLAFNDGTPFADDVTREWIARDVLQESDWQTEKVAATTAGADDDILLLESEALALADSEGVEAALAWLQTRPGIISRRQRWLRQLLMARLTEQCGRNDLALHLLGELNTTAHSLTLKQWEPELLFEVKARRLKLLRLKANRSESDKARLASEMESLLSGLVAIDPARAAVLCG